MSQSWFWWPSFVCARLCVCVCTWTSWWEMNLLENLVHISLKAKKMGCPLVFSIRKIISDKCDYTTMWTSFTSQCELLVICAWANSAYYFFCSPLELANGEYLAIATHRHFILLYVVHTFCMNSFLRDRISDALLSFFLAIDRPIKD